MRPIKIKLTEADGDVEGGESDDDLAMVEVDNDMTYFDDANDLTVRPLVCAPPFADICLGH